MGASKARDLLGGLAVSTPIMILFYDNASSLMFCNFSVDHDARTCYIHLHASEIITIDCRPLANYGCNAS